MTFRSLADIDGLERAASAGAPAVVIGGGLLGIEAAYGLARRGMPVTLVHLMDRLMERQLDAEGARAAGRCDARPRACACCSARRHGAIRGDSAVEAVELADGRVLPCGLVVMAVGIRPSTALAASGRPAGEARHRRRRRHADIGCRASTPSANARSIAVPATAWSSPATSRRASPPRRWPASRRAMRARCWRPISRSRASRCSRPAISRAAGAETIVVRDAGQRLLPQAGGARGASGGRRAGRRYGRGAVVRGPDPLWRSPVSAFREALAFGQAFAEAA